MKAYYCKVCGYVHFGEKLPEICPQCGANKDFFDLRNESLEKGYVVEHVLGIARDSDDITVESLRKCYEEDSKTAAKYLCMSRQADKEGYPEIANCYRRFAIEKLGLASKTLELLGEDVLSSTQDNLEKARINEEESCKRKNDIAIHAKEKLYDSIHDLIHEEAKEDSRIGNALSGILNRYYKD